MRTLALLTCFLALAAPSARAHCDTLDGPVVAAARAALKSGDVNLVLVWVQPKDAPELRKTFEQTLAVRKLSAQARELADRAFFETLVRVHRAGEGAAYTGLKPAGLDAGPAIPAADKALQTGEIAPVIELVNQAAAETVKEKFRRVREASGYGKSDVEAGRRYVEAYVSYLHAVERLYDAAAHAPAGHAEEESAHRD
ncbi:MAG: DUF6448 family protein [Myxococcales bacterium]